MPEQKHAVLLMLHRDFSLAEKLISLLRNKRIDFYIHVDKKADFFEFDSLKNAAPESGVFFLPRKKVNWGGYSQIQCELSLLRAASFGHYAYYHLLSGADFPLKRIEDILSFFDAQEGREFVHFSSPELSPQDRDRFCVYHPFQELCTRNRLLEKIEWQLVQLQKRVGIDRVKNKNLKFAKGANWFSITDSLAQFILSHKKEIKKRYAFSRCCDEIFLQTLVINSPYREKLYQKTFDDDYLAILREIDWKRGEPYTWQKEDLEQLLSSKCLFARKFDSEKSKELIEQLSARLK